MWLRSRLLLVALAAALMLTVSVGVADANRLNLSTTSFTIRWREFYVPTGVRPEELGELEETTRCPVTLSGSFHARTFAKVRDSLIGYVSAAQSSICTNGMATVLRTGLPWHLTYQGFTGALPAISSARSSLIGFGLSVFVPRLGSNCLIRTTAAEPLPLDFNRQTATGRITDVTIPIGNQISATGGILCPTRWTLGGAPATLETGGGASVTVTLI